ncbi:MAG: hypothetical protein AAF959_19115 [Cyanobacteria bacterium P01_D01_bin.56]
MLSKLLGNRWILGVSGAIALLITPLNMSPLATAATEIDTNISLSPLEPLDAANQFFTFRDEPINPRAVGDLLPWLSDTEPGPIALDVEGSLADTNRYWAEVSVVEDGPAAGTVTATWNPWLGDNTTYTTGYRWLGQLDNGLHILRVAKNTGGSGVFTSLLFIRFSMDTEYANGPGPRQRLVMTRMGSQGLGDRDGRAVRLEGNHVVIEPGNNFETVRIDLTDY